VLTLLLLLPLCVVVLLNLPWPKRFTDALALWAAMLVCLFEVGMVFCPERGAWMSDPHYLYSLLGWQPVIDNLTLVMLVATGLVGLVSLMIARYVIEDPQRLFVFVNLTLLGIAGMNGVVLATDLFSLYVFLELTAVCSFVLITFDHEITGYEGAFKYLILSALATLLLLSAVGLFLLVAGSTSFIEIRAAFAGPQNQGLLLVASTLFVVGLLIKGGVMPFHGWLPDAYSGGPTPTSVLLGGIVTKTTGVYTLIRTVDTVFVVSDKVRLVLLFVGALSVVGGALAALGQGSFRRMLAYSSISQVGYIILGLGVGTALGLVGAILHLFNHAIFKTLLFVNAAAVEKETKTQDTSALGGLAERMPVTGASSVIGLLSTAGIPPLSGFWSKLIIIVALWQSGHQVYAWLAVLASVLTLAYFLSFQRRVFFGKVADSCATVREANAWVVVPAVILALITVGVGVAFPWIIGSFLAPLSMRSIL
jgi:proton-translocating NADH-quinone oxidoreductase chain N